jgi:hypothetical protein
VTQADVPGLKFEIQPSLAAKFVSEDFVHACAGRSRKRQIPQAKTKASATINTVHRTICCHGAIAMNKNQQRTPSRAVRQLQIALAAMFTISASRAVLNTNEMMPCTVAVRRMILSVIPTSETCAVMPMTKEK